MWKFLLETSLVVALNGSGFDFSAQRTVGSVGRGNGNELITLPVFTGNDVS